VIKYEIVVTTPWLLSWDPTCRISRDFCTRRQSVGLPAVALVSWLWKPRRRALATFAAISLPCSFSRLYRIVCCTFHGIVATLSKGCHKTWKRQNSLEFCSIFWKICQSNKI